MSAVNEDPNPLPPDSGGGGGQSDPDQGKDLRYLDPTVGVVWTEDTYNSDPFWATQSGSGGAPPPMADSGTIKVNLGSVRSVELNLLSNTQQAADQYMGLRQAVMNSTVTPYYWGPEPPTNAQTDSNPVDAHAGLGDGGNADPYAGSQQQLSDMGQQFGSMIDPVMEKALYQVAGALEALGTFITTVNLTGQMYGQIDRACKFPETP
ncbi:hypothetical protein [Actinacidiphila oryziradicis]|uniref:Uncharacterized protein n=1 Tax=Actinacidiphila oryziradicis TaxID=2571141 RepID=A0A4U0S4T9_9ACTN|nr:hypothetical protein [Actinacidiphila oryziradicis]TKA02071.1 hypothetical protein FCI23_39190 [Actinacidiphila oryziradicis]